MGNIHEMECINQIKGQIKTKQYEVALDIILQNKDRYRDSAGFLKVEAILCMEVGEYATAKPLLKKAKMLDPSDGEIYYYLSLVYEQLEASESIIIVNSDEKQPVVFSDEWNLYHIRQQIEESLGEAGDPYVSIVLTAYNNLERLTKPMLDSLFKNTKGIDYELILIDNGSTDGTFEYFKTIPYSRKKIYRITKNIGAFFGYHAAQQACTGRFVKGKFIVNGPNDIIFTPNWLSNMLRCIESNEKIGVVVPMFDNCSNFQSIPLEYNSFNDLQEKAAAFNRSDPSKWEERMRIIPVLWMRRRDLIGLFDGDNAFIHNFADDDMSCQYRRAGYKLMVCGDVLIHHEGSCVVGANQKKFEDDLAKGRKIYQQKYYGIDAWDDVNNYERNMFKVLAINENEQCNCKCLGVDVRCGVPLLELKNRLTLMQTTEHKFYAFSTEAKYWLDLKTICNQDVICDRIEYIEEDLQEVSFDYIILGKYIDQYNNPLQVLQSLCNLLSCKGKLAIKCSNPYGLSYLEEHREDKKIFFSELLSEKIREYLLQNGYKILRGGIVEYDISQAERGLILEGIPMTFRYKKSVVENIFVQESIFVIVKDDFCD